VALAGLIASCSSTPSTPDARAAYIAELVQAYDIEGVVSRSQTDALADAHRNIETVRSQFSDVLAQVTPAQQRRLDAAMDRFVTASRVTPDMNTAAAVWAQGFAENLTNEDLQRIVEFSRTPAGRAQIAAGRDAGVQLRAYLYQQRSASVERAAQQYIAELRAIVAGR
jgi:hypothetical protein